MNDLLTVAHHYRAAHLSTIAIKLDGTKSPAPEVGSWARFQRRLPTDSELHRWFTGDRCGIAVLMGEISRNLECLDFDEPEQFWRWRERLEAETPGLVERLVWEMTPSGGFHILYRASAVHGNQKLALRMETSGETAERLAALQAQGVAPTARQREPKPITLIETRGEGGYAACSPTLDYTLRQGDIACPPTINAEEHETLHRLARSFNEYVRLPGDIPQRCPPRAREDGVILPGDDFNARGDPLPFFERHGWRIDGAANGEVRLTRPGKEKGTSATWGYYPGYLVVFSSNASPFVATDRDNPQGYDAFAICALLEHDGNFREAAKALYQQGYGTRRVSQERPARPTLDHPYRLGHEELARLLTPTRLTAAQITVLFESL